MKSIYTIIILSFLATFVPADEITGLNLRTTAGSQAQYPTATASTFLTLGADKKPVFLNAANSRTLLGLNTMALEPTSSWLDKAGNLSGLANVATSRTNLGLGTGNSPTFLQVFAYNLEATSDVRLSKLNFNNDAYFTRKAAANIRRGDADVASPVAQYDSVQNVSTGTSNTAGVPRYYDGSQGTGTGNGGSLVERTAPPGASGSAQNALTIRRFVFGGEKNLTESTATIVVNVSVAAGKYIGGELIVTTHADDATDFQAITEHLTFSAVNKGGTVTATIQAAPSTSTTAASAGTLTTTWTAVANGNSVDIKNDAASSLTQTALKCSYQLRLNTDDTVTVTP